MSKLVEQSKKVFLVDSYAMNTGDMGILFSLVDALKGISVDIIGIESSHPKGLMNINDKSLASISLYPRIFNIEKLTGTQEVPRTSGFASTLLGLYDSLCFLSWAVFYHFTGKGYWIIRKSRRSQAKSIAKADYIWSVGGGFLSTHYKYLFRLYIQFLAIILGKKMVIFSQSIGPFDSWLSKKLIPWFLRKAHYVSTREPWSYNYLTSFGVVTKRAHDIAFNLDCQKTRVERRVAFCVKKASNSYDTAIISCAEKLIKDGYGVVFVSQTPADDDKINHYRSCLSDSGAEFYQYGMNPRDTKAIYGACEFIVSSRMHAIIFASENGVPFISVSYEPKFIGLHKALNYPSELMLDESSLTTEDLSNAVIILQKNRLKYRNDLIETTKKIKDINISNLNSIFNGQVK